MLSVVSCALSCAGNGGDAHAPGTSVRQVNELLVWSFNNRTDRPVAAFLYLPSSPVAGACRAPTSLADAWLTRDPGLGLKVSKTMQRLPEDQEALFGTAGTPKEGVVIVQPGAVVSGAYALGRKRYTRHPATLLADREQALPPPSGAQVVMEIEWSFDVASVEAVATPWADDIQNLEVLILNPAEFRGETQIARSESLEWR